MREKHIVNRDRATVRLRLPERFRYDERRYLSGLPWNRRGRIYELYMIGHGESGCNLQRRLYGPDGLRADRQRAAVRPARSGKSSAAWT